MASGSTAITYGYDADGRRIKKVESGQVTVYVGRHYERNITTGVVTKYYEALGQPVATWVGTPPGGNVSYLYRDRLGSTVAASNGSTATYWPYGGQRSSGGSLGTDRRFTGQRLDAYINLYEMGARRYDPALGRFLQPDSIVPNPANPQDLNRYVYARSNPLRYIDPTGHAAALPVCPSWDCNTTWVTLDFVVEGDPVRRLASGLAAEGLCVLAGCHYDADTGEIRGPTTDEYMGAERNGLLIGGPSSMGAAPIKGGGRLFQSMGRISRKLPGWVREAFREEARKLFESFGRSRGDLEIHHRIPLEWAHLFPDADPNRIANLLGLAEPIHRQVGEMWAAFRTRFQRLGREPTAAEVLEWAMHIDEEFGQHYVYPK